MTVLDEIGRSRYVSLTTYRRNGTPVATPVWHVRDGAELFVVTEVATAPDAPSAEGTARLLDDAGTQAARTLLARKYLMSRLGNWLTGILHIPRRPLVGIAVTF